VSQGNDKDSQRKENSRRHRERESSKKGKTVGVSKFLEKKKS